MAQILLVADTAWVVNQTRSALAGPANDIHVLDDPHQLLDVALDVAPDITIVDMQIGSMGGMAVVRMLRDAIMAGEIRPGPALLLLDRAADEFLANRAGADAWLLKPFTAQDLAGRVAELIAVAEPT
jgi:DNA-binding response OmpR family regulator